MGFRISFPLDNLQQAVFSLDFSYLGVYCKAPDVEIWGAEGPTFTAPHGVNLLRDGKPEHLPETWLCMGRGCLLKLGL